MTDDDETDDDEIGDGTDDNEIGDGTDDNEIDDNEIDDNEIDDNETMTTTKQVAMSEAEIDEFLGRRQTAVISLPDETEPYAVPITYRFDPESRTFYFRLIFARGSEKRRFLPDVPDARLVVYEEDTPSYRSVIAVGAPEEVDPSELTPERVVQFGRTARPLFEMWEDSKGDLDVRLYELDPERLTGRQITTDAD